MAKPSKAASVFLMTMLLIGVEVDLTPTGVMLPSLVSG
jgi:hypothetical protein